MPGQTKARPPGTNRGLRWQHPRFNKCCNNSHELMMEELTRDNEGLVGATNDEAPGHADGDADVLKKSYSDTHTPTPP